VARFSPSEDIRASDDVEAAFVVAHVLGSPKIAGNLDVQETRNGWPNVSPESVNLVAAAIARPSAGNERKLRKIGHPLVVGVARAVLAISVRNRSRLRAWYFWISDVRC
jgi:hypothetical protein